MVLFYFSSQACILTKSLLGEVGSVLYLTDLLDEEKHQEAADKARVGPSAGFGQVLKQ